MMRIFALLNLSAIAHAQLCAQGEFVDYSQGQNAGDGVCATCPEGKTLAAGNDPALPRYYFNPDVLTWADAEAACVARGAHLTSIEDQTKQNEMTALVEGDSGYWIGGFKAAGNTDGQWSWVDDPTTMMEEEVSTGFPGGDTVWDPNAPTPGDRVDSTGIQIYLFCRADGSEWQFDRDIHTYPSMCEAMTCEPIPDVNCDGSWSACTAACEAAADRTWTETTAQSGAGDACPATTDCAAGDGECVAVNCDGSWSACTAACEAAANRTWTETAAPLAGGDACPAATDCAAGDDDCTASDEDSPPPPSPSSAKQVTAIMAAAAVVAGLVLQ